MDFLDSDELEPALEPPDPLPDPLGEAGPEPGLELHEPLPPVVVGLTGSAVLDPEGEVCEPLAPAVIARGFIDVAMFDTEPVDEGSVVLLASAAEETPKVTVAVAELCAASVFETVGDWDEGMIGVVCDTVGASAAGKNPPCTFAVPNRSLGTLFHGSNT